MVRGRARDERGDVRATAHVGRSADRVAAPPGDGGRDRLEAFGATGTEDDLRAALGEQVRRRLPMPLLAPVMAATDISTRTEVVSRWQPDSRRRLQEAAAELYAAQGFTETTVAAIAARAGLTERTYFRHFSDKREVLFANEDALRGRLVDAVLAADAGASPSQAAASGLDAVAGDLQPHHAALRRRAPIIAAHPELRERELIKLASWTSALAGALRERGVAGPAATLTAEDSIAVFDVAAGRRLAAGRAQPEFVDVFAAARAELRALSRLGCLQRGG